MAWWSRLDRPWVELLLVLGLVLFALAVRWPYLLRLPHFTDEIGEIRWAIRIWRGEILPLTGYDKYYGPLLAYLTAGALWLFGPHIIIPRAIVMVLGALTVGATYLLGREVGGRAVGFLAAALLATAPQHIVVNSHVAWLNSTHPLYATLCLWAFARALRGARRWAEPGKVERFWSRDGPYLVLAGFFYGLTLQMHVGAIFLIPALVAAYAWALWRERSWRRLREPWPYAAVAAALLAYGPVLLHNLMHGLEGFRRAPARNDYAFVSDPSWEVYRHNLRNLVFELMRIVSNPMRIPERPLHYLTSPYMVVAVGLCLAGLALLVRRGRPLLPLVLLASLLLLPRYLHAYGVEGDRYLVTGRFVGYLHPPLVVAIAVGALGLAGAALRALPRRWRGLPLREPTRAVPLALLALLVIYPLQPLGRYYTHESRLDPDNATFLETVRLINQARGPRTPILVDNGLIKIDLKDGAVVRDILDTLLTLDGVPHQVSRNPREDLTRLAAAAGDDPEALPIIIMMRDDCWPLRDEVPLQRISGRLRLRELYWTLPSYYAIYRYAPPPQPAACLPPEGPIPGD